MTDPFNIPSGIQWPVGIDANVFLSEYWQKKPLLIRQAFPDFQSPISADELAGLSLEAETTPRLIIQDEHGHYHLEHGPFEEDRFSTLTGNDWSLLVTDVEKHLPELIEYVKPFHFLPSWRIDDLMISYAPVGASVGAHVDEYDVFLLQATGGRQWSIADNDDHPIKFVENSDLQLIDDFKPSDTWDLQPGDMLYLPPGVAHHGIAIDDPCTTWSIGFRAPAIPDMILRMSEMIAESLPATRYRDMDLDIANPGELTADAIAQIREIWQTTTHIEPESFANLIAAYLTEPGVASADQNIADLDTDDEEILGLQKAPFTQMVWHEAGAVESLDSSQAPVTLYVDGDVYFCSKKLAVDLCGSAIININEIPPGLKSDIAVVKQLLQNGGVSYVYR